MYIKAVGTILHARIVTIVLSLLWQHSYLVPTLEGVPENPLQLRQCNPVSRRGQAVESIHPRCPLPAFNPQSRLWKIARSRWTMGYSACLVQNYGPRRLAIWGCLEQIGPHPQIFQLHDFSREAWILPCSYWTSILSRSQTGKVHHNLVLWHVGFI